MVHDHDCGQFPELSGLDPGRAAELLESARDGVEKTWRYGVLTAAAVGVLLLSLWLGKGIADRTGNPVLGFFPAGGLMSLSMIGYWFGRLALVRRDLRRKLSGSDHDNSL